MRSPDGQRPLGLLLVHLTAKVPQAAAQAKVGDLGGLVVIHEDIPSREVTMDDLENNCFLSNLIEILGIWSGLEEIAKETDLTL